MKNTLDKIKRFKFTTTLSKECLESLPLIKAKYGVKFDNHLFELLVKKEIGEILNEMDKQKNQQGETL